jgi:hypothetical protein
LSEQAKITSLQEKLKEERSRARWNGGASAFFLILGVIGFVLYFNSIGEMWLNIFLGFGGVILFCVFTFLEFVANKRKTQLMRELDSMGIRIPICPECGKQLPQGSYEFCPFCDFPLSPPPSTS